jgi:hypothetical protein
MLESQLSLTTAAKESQWQLPSFAFTCMNADPDVKTNIDTCEDSNTVFFLSHVSQSLDNSKVDYSMPLSMHQ